MSDLAKPKTNDELFLATISGDYSGSLPKPLTRAQEYLEKIAQNGAGGGETVDLSGYATKEELTGKKTAEGGEIFNDYENNVASAEHSHAEGNGTTAKGKNSHAEGDGTFASAINSHSEGDGTVTKGEASHAEGWHSRTEAKASHAEGYMTVASGNYSHTEGLGTKALKQSSHAEGESTTANGNYSHAEGYNTTTSGYGSHAEGNATTASGDYSHAEGAITIAASAYQHVQGKCNVEDAENKYAFIIGNGENRDNRSNAVAIDWNGRFYFNNSTEGIDLSKFTDAKFESWEAAVQQIGNIQTALENIVEVSE